MNNQNTSNQMFEVFYIVRQLHELLWYLTEALSFKEAYSLQEQINSLLEITERYTSLTPDEIINLDIEKHWTDVNAILLRTSELVRHQSGETSLPFKYKKTFNGRADLFARDLRKFNLSGANLRGACLIAADIRELDLCKTDFIGADLRDTDIRGANLSQSIFLTQSQINVAKGDSNTKLSPSLTRPINWLV